MPVAGPAALSAERYLELMAVDKKAAQGRIRFILLAGLGSAVIADGVPPETVRATLAACTAG